MKRHLKYINMVWASMLLLGSCTNESGTGIPDVTPVVPSKLSNNTETAVSQDEITLNLTGNKYSEADTRAIIIYSTDSLRVRNKDIARIDAFYGSTSVKYLDATRIRYDGTNWLFHTGTNWTKHFWPIPNSHDVSNNLDVDGTLDFVGYIPFDIPSSETVGEYNIVLDNERINPPKFTCSLPITIGTTNTFGDSEQSTLQEFLFAYLPNQTTTTQSAAGGKLNLPFQHPFALVNFYLKEAKRGTTINRVTLEGIKTKGTYTYGDTPAWTFGETNYPANLVITLSSDKNDVPGELNFNGLIGGPYVVLPQALSGSDNLTVNRTYGEDTRDISATIATTWQPGKIYNYYLDLGKDENQILLDVVVQDWVTQEYKIPIDIY